MEKGRRADTHTVCHQVLFPFHCFEGRDLAFEWSPEDPVKVLFVRCAVAVPARRAGEVLRASRVGWPMKSAAPKRALATLATLATLAATLGACTPESVIRDRRAEGEGELAALKRIGERAKAAPATPASKLRPTPEPLVVCSFDGSGGVRGCNTILEYTETLIAPTEWRDYSHNPGRDQIVFWHSAVVVNPARLLSSGDLLIESIDLSRDPSHPTYKEERIPQKVQGVKHWFDNLAAVHYVFALRPTPAARPGSVFSVDAFLADARTGADHGVMRVEGSCTNKSYVYASGPNAGKYAGGTSCLDSTAKRAFEAELLKQMPSATFQR